MLKRAVRNRELCPTNIGELKAALAEEWAGLDRRLRRRMVESMGRRVAAVLAADGGPTKY